MPDLWTIHDNVVYLRHAVQGFRKTVRTEHEALISCYIDDLAEAVEQLTEVLNEPKEVTLEAFAGRAEGTD